MKSIYTGMLISPAHWDGLAVYDCDLQDPPALMLSFIDFWLGGQMLCTVNDRSGMKFLRRQCLEKSSNTQNANFIGHQDKLNQERFVSAKVVMQIKKRRNFQEYLPAVIDNLGSKRKGVKALAQTEARHTRLNFFYLKYALDGLIVGSFLPLRCRLLGCCFQPILNPRTLFHFLKRSPGRNSGGTVA